MSDEKLSRAFSLPPDYFEVLRQSAFSVERINNVDAVTTAQGITYGYCHIPFFYAFSFFNDPNLPRQPFNFQGPFEGAAAAHLAMMHLNTGDGSIVPEVQALNETCKVRFTFELFDTEAYQTTAVNRVLQLRDREPNKTAAEHAQPCAFLGAGRSALTIAMSILTGEMGYPQMSGISTSSELDDRSQYRLFSRLIPSDDGTAIPVILYLRDVIQTNHLAVVHSNNAYGNAFLASLQKAATQFAPTMNIQSINVPINVIAQKDLETAVSFLKNTQFRYIFAMVEGTKNYEGLMTEAYRQGIAGDDYVWIYSDTLFPEVITDRNYTSPEDPLAIASRGSSLLQIQWAVPGSPAFNNFVSSFQELKNHPDHLDFLQSKHPVYEGEPDYEPIQVDRIFRFRDPGNDAAFVYDSTIAMGLAACAVTEPTTYFDGQMHYDRIVNSSFVGVTGSIAIDPTTSSRIASSAAYQLLNFVQRQDPITGKVTFDAVQSDLFQNGKWESLTPYVYSDGTTNRPKPLPVVEVNNNYIKAGLRGTGFALSALVILLSIGFAAWTIRRRESKVVNASQPIFLHMIWGGVLLMGSAIIPLSFDDEIASSRGCDIACMSTPWLFTIGFALCFAALFAKTWRICRIFFNPALKRIKVTPRDVMAPLIVLLVVNVLVLSLWTALFPLKWEREITRVDVFGQTVETEGRCESDAIRAFVAVLAVVNMGALIVAAYQAYRARDISSQFSESNYIGGAIGLFLLACLYGIPVLIIAWNDPSARYFVLMILAFVCSISVLLLIFVPKVIFDRRGGFKKASHVVAKHVTAGSSPMPSTDGSGAFVSGLTENASSQPDDPDDRGIKVVDNGRLRKELKESNRELREERHKLQQRVNLLERLLTRATPDNIGDEGTATFSDAEEEGKEM